MSFGVEGLEAPPSPSLVSSLMKLCQFMLMTAFIYGDMLFVEFSPNPSCEILCENISQLQVARNQKPTNSGDFMKMIGELTCMLTQQVASKKEELRYLNTLVGNVQVT